MLAALLLYSSPAVGQQRTIVDASAPTDLAVTVYRDPERHYTQELDSNWPRGFAMISETRTVTLPPGESTIRFTGVAEGMVAVSAIVTGLPGGTIEKNRNADLLSPAALVDGTLGNRVRVTRTNPGNGEEVESSAIIRTRADGGLVLQTDQGYEAVRCSGVPERLSFDSLPDGLSAQPVFTIDTSDASGGTYAITLTYLAWGFDWQANYVATLEEGRSSDDLRLHLMSWLTILNDNGQTFADAELLAVAGTLNVVSDFEELSDPPEARPMRLTCYPLGSSLIGSPVPQYGSGAVDEMFYQNGAIPPPPAPMMRSAVADMEASSPIVVTGSFLRASEENLGDLKLYRIPERVNVNAQGLKQIAFLDRGDIEASFLYNAQCDLYDRYFADSEPEDEDETRIILATTNDEEHGLGVALPMGRMALFEPTSAGELLVGELDLRDYAVDQDVELDLGLSSQVFYQCGYFGDDDAEDNVGKWTPMRVALSNANDAPVDVRVTLGSPGDFDFRWRGRTPYLKDGLMHVDVRIPANSKREFSWQARWTYEES